MKLRPATPILALALAQILILPGIGLAAEDLPVTKVALYSSGVGYFEHRGTIKGDVTVPLPFSTAEVNDALKSLVARDPAATEASGSPTVSYPSLETVDETLRGLRIDLSASPTVPVLLARLRGAELEVQAPETVLGRIVSVEKRATGGEGLVRDSLVLLTAKGVVALALDEIASFRFTDPAVMADFNRALALVLGARDADRRQLDLRFPGSGNREVSFGYIVAAPVWKVSYRLDLSGSQPWIQGWAIVDNPSETDWRNVSLSLVSGRPVSFIQNLYPPLRLGRPVLPLSIAGTAEARVFESGLGDLEEEDYAKDYAPAAPMASRAAAAPSARGAGLAKKAEAPAAESAFALASTAVTTTAARQAGDQFEFTVKSPVSLERGRSAMLPLVAGAMAAEKLSIWSQGNGAKHPMLGVRLTNSLGMKLPAGPITVFDGGSYAGDALVEFFPEKDKRLVVYGEDLSVTCVESTSSSRETVGVSFSKGVLLFSRRTTAVRLYEFRNASASARKLLVEHPRLGGAELLSPVVFEEKTDAVYRFPLPLPASGSARLEVKERYPAEERIVLTGSGAETFLSWASSSEIPANIKEALKKAAELRVKLEDAKRNLADLQARRGDLANEQARIRQNLDAVGRDSSQGQQYLKRLMDAESALDQNATKTTEARKAVQDAQAAFDGYVANISIGS
ncbi:MAG: hypothetical protein JNG85_08360 [Spirochaetaceae bacterium]|nr:hypothetical protein [Spirochaetaceae bacterium]